MANLRTNNLCGRGFVSVNDGTIWSSLFDGSTLGSYPVTNAFDGDVSTFMYPAAGTSITWTAPNGGIKSERIEVYVYAGNTHPIVTVNGVSTGAVVGADYGQQGNWVDVTSLVGGNLKTITCFGETIGGIARQSGFSAVRINGEILVDGEYGTTGGRRAYRGSVFFDGRDDVTALQVINEASSDDFTLSGDFTIEFWWLSRGGKTYHCIFDTKRANSTAGIEIFLTSDGHTYFYGGSNGSTIMHRNEKVNANDGSWHHIAITRSGSSNRVFVDGNLDSGYSAGSDSTTYISQLNRPSIGGDGSSFADNAAKGYLSNLRVVKGTALYTANFTPPTEELTMVDGTVLLCCQDSDNPLQEATGKKLLGQGGVYHGRRFSNLAANGNLENGDTTNWVNGGLATFEVSTDNPHSGSYSLHCTSDSNGDACAYVIPVTLDTQKRYKISAYINVVGPGGTSARAKMKIGSGVGGNENYESEVVGQGNNGLGNWAYVEWIGLATADTTHVTFNESSSNNVNDYFVDDLRIELWYPEEGVNILGNPRFTSNSTGAATGWAFSSGNSPATEWSIANGKLSVTDTSRTNDAIASQTLFYNSIKEGRYQVTLDYSVSSGDFDIGIGNGRLFGVANTHNGGAGSADTFTAFLQPAGGNASFRIVANQYCVADFFSVHLSRVPEPKAPKVIPPYGVDAGNAFGGPIQQNTQGYMCFPTGRTEERGRGRGIWGGGWNSPSNTSTKRIDFIQIQSGGTAQDFGDLTVGGNQIRGVSSSTRGVFIGGRRPHPGVTNIMDFVTISTTANALDFGDLLTGRGAVGEISNQTRGISAAGYTPSNVNTIEFITIASLGNSQDFGDMLNAGSTMAGTQSSTRGILAGNYAPSSPNTTNVIEFLTIATTGNTQDFGDLTDSRHSPSGTSNGVRAVIAAGTHSPGNNNTMDFVTIATTGNATDFGDLITVSLGQVGATSDKIRGVFGGGSNSPLYHNVIQQVIISTTGDSVDIGDLTLERLQAGCVSDAHGGLS